MREGVSACLRPSDSIKLASNATISAGGTPERPWTSNAARPYSMGWDGSCENGSCDGVGNGMENVMGWNRTGQIVARCFHTYVRTHVAHTTISAYLGEL